MCGICGYFGQEAHCDVQAMTSAMSHRGPDDSGLVRGEAFSLGMTRLAVLDTSPLGRQPMGNRDGTVWMVYNGEVYNFRTLRGELEKKGHSFATGTDTEVVLRLYEESGPSFLSRLRGMFALAIVDLRRGPGRERLLLARDHLGVKPLAYSRRNGGLAFASELKALLAGDAAAPSIDPFSLRCLLAMGSVPQPRTILSGVEMLGPGWMLVCEDGGVRLEKWWDIGRDRVPGLREAHPREQAQAVRAALEECVGLQLVSDVPVGAFLSGGVDSAVLAALMSRATGARVKTFSLGFGPEGSHLDETQDALAMARHLGTDHTRVEVDGAMAREAILDMASSLDQPSVDGVNTYFVSRAAKRDVTVALSGTGGDELFGGYPWFAGMSLWEEDRLSGRLPFPARRGILSPRFNRLALTCYAWNLERRRAHAGFEAQFHRQYRLFATGLTARLLHPDLRDRARAGRDASLDHPLDGNLPHWSPVEKAGALCLRGYTQSQLLRDIDAMSMTHSLEVRVPYLDPVLVDLSFSLPDEAKLGPTAALRDPTAATYDELGVKRVLMDSCRDLLPPGIGSQPKRGFTLPFKAWLNGPLAEVAGDTLSYASLQARGLFEPGRAAGQLALFKEGKAHWWSPWVLMMTELWCRQVLDGAGRA